MKILVLILVCSFAGGSIAYSYTTINGQRVEVTVAAAFQRLRSAFTAAFPGIDLLVTSGTRTRAEQARLYDGWIKKRPGFNLAAPPGKSNHEESGPRGPRALDLRDSGSDPGVTRIGTKRSNWLAANALRSSFEAAGHRFKPAEGWHYEFTGPLNGGTAPQPAPNPAKRPILRQGARGQEVRDLQARLKSNYSLYAGKLAVDGIYGPASVAAVREFQRRAVLTVDGIVGAATWARLGF